MPLWNFTLVLRKWSKNLKQTDLFIVHYVYQHRLHLCYTQVIMSSINENIKKVSNNINTG